MESKKEKVLEKIKNQIPLDNEDQRIFLKEVLGQSEIDVNFIMAGSPDFNGKMSLEELKEFYGKLLSEE